MWNLAVNNIPYPIYPLSTRTEKGYITKIIPFFFCSVYIYSCYIIFIIYTLRVSIFMTSPLGVAVVCCLYKEVYLQILNVCPFDYTAVARSGKVGPVNQVIHTSWVAVVTQTDRPKSVRHRCIIELFCGVVCVVTLHV